MRLGNNPNKHEKIEPLPRIVVAVITHLPDLESDYHRGRLDVIKHSLTTLTENIRYATEEYDLIVWDNGSCQQLRDWLDGYVCKRVYSCNVGKTNALKMLMRMVPEGTIFAYGDDDMEYFPGWLAPQIEILETFPNVGTVTGWPVRITGTWGIETTKRWANMKVYRIFEDEPLHTVEQGRFIPGEWERDYCDNVNADWQAYSAATWAVNDYRITYKGVSAYAMSQHCQFVCYPERVEQLIPWTDDAMAAEIPFDKAVDAAGLLRLATVERLTRHMGNVLERVE